MTQYGTESDASFESTKRRYPNWVNSEKLVAPEVAAQVISEALPYIQAFSGHTFVIKYGGSVMEDGPEFRSVIRNVLLLQSVGIRVVLVHGGGKEITKLANRLGISQSTVNGFRVTSLETMEVVEMSLAGKTNKAIVSAFGQAGGMAVGYSGRDGQLLIGEVMDDALGRVGQVTEIHPHLLNLALDTGYIPVVASIGEDDKGDALNFNADSAAASIAIALSATKLIVLTDTNGVRANKADPASTISQLKLADLYALIESGAADQGMVPKLLAGAEAIEAGVERVHFLDGKQPNALLIELFTEAGIGTMLVGDSH